MMSSGSCPKEEISINLSLRAGYTDIRSLRFKKVITEIKTSQQSACLIVSRFQIGRAHV